MNNGVKIISDYAIDDQKNVHKELKKKNDKTLFIIHQCVDRNKFEKVEDVDASKEAWDKFEKYCVGAEKVNEVML